METHELYLASIESGQIVDCVVIAEFDDEAVLEVTSDAMPPLRAEGYDFEEALEVLRAELEERGFFLLCNRYRRDAFVSSLARQMSNGLSCYLVRPRVPVDPEKLVSSLDPAPAELIVSRDEADAYIQNWLATRPSLLLLAWYWAKSRFAD